MKTFKINGQIIKALSLTDAVKSCKDSDRLKQLAYKFAEMGSYFDRANSASSREILSKNDENKMFDYYKLALEIKKQLQKEIPLMKNEKYLGSWEDGNETVKLLTDAISRFYWTTSESAVKRRCLLRKCRGHFLERHIKNKSTEKWFVERI